MKHQVLNNEKIQFYNSAGELMGEIFVSGSGDLVMFPTSGSSKDIILGNQDTVGDVEIGLPSAEVSLKLMGGGTFTGNGNTLNIGATNGTDTVNLYNVTYSQSLAVTGSVNVVGGISTTTSASFLGLPTSEPSITGSLWISGSSVAQPSSSYLMIFNP
tara:strand:+ start:175 stop:648 length:474 start_codon:yes stop_codon:yes gene_type:complete